MNIFQSKPVVKVINLREDYKIEVFDVPIDTMASNICTISRNGKRKYSWMVIHQLFKPVYNFPGIPDGTRCLLVTPRDIRFDPLGELGDEYSDEKIKKLMLEIAKEQQYKVEESGAMGLLNRSTAFLAASAFIIFLAVVIVGGLKFYWGG